MAGPAGLSTYVGPPCGEDGCYAVVLVGENILAAMVYETPHSYECFCPKCSWREVGRLLDIRGFMVLWEKMYAGGRELSMSIWDAISAKHYRVLYAIQTDATVVYLRVRSDRMPLGFYVVYRLYGIDTKDLWWRASGCSCIGTLSHDEADAICCDQA